MPMGQAQNPGEGEGARSAGGMAQIRFGVYNQPGPHAGKTIAEIRGGIGKLWGIPTDASAYLGSSKVGDDYVIQPGDNIEFHRRAGEKG